MPTLPTEPARQIHRTPCASCGHKVLVMRRALSEGHRGEHAIAAGALLCASCAAWARPGPAVELVRLTDEQVEELLAAAARNYQRAA